jgi:hypothetical protein
LRHSGNTEADQAGKQVGADPDQSLSFVFLVAGFATKQSSLTGFANV